jgi:hypothetical protein
MNRDILSYVKLFKNELDGSICEKSILQLESADWKQHEFYDPFRKEYAPRSGNLELEMARKHISTRDYLMDKIYKCLFRYTNDLNFAWFNGWSGYTEIRYNRYQKNSFMAEHCDHIHDIFDGERQGVPILTVLGLLNDNYSGGEFIMFENITIPLSGSDILVFPSNFLFPHRVEPVKYGIRYSFISWAW